MFLPVQRKSARFADLMLAGLLMCAWFPGEVARTVRQQEPADQAGVAAGNDDFLQLKDKQGRTIEARFVVLEGHDLTVILKSGKESTFAFSLLSPESAETVRNCAGIKGEGLTQPELADKVQETVFANEIAEVYRRALADETIDAKRVNRLDELYEEALLAAADEKWLIAGKYLTVDEVKEMRLKSLEYIRESRSGFEAGEWGDGFRALENAARVDAVAPHAEMLNGLFQSLIARDHSRAVPCYREAARRCRVYRRILDLTAPQLEVAALNNLALASIHVGNINDARDIWESLRDSGQQLPLPLRENVAYAFRWLAKGQQAPHFDFFGKQGDKVLEENTWIAEWAGFAELQQPGRWQYMWFPPVVDYEIGDEVWIDPNLLIDNRCLGCNGRSRLKCKACVNGARVERFKKPVKLPNGLVVYEEGQRTVKCKNCKGRGTLDCPCCDEGQAGLDSH